MIAQLWYCQKCSAAARTVDAKIPMHPCPGVAGMLVPLARQGSRVEHVVHEREDYVGRELVQVDANGRPIMNIITKRDDGEDCTAYAPTAHIAQEC